MAKPSPNSESVLRSKRKRVLGDAGLVSFSKRSKKIKRDHTTGDLDIHAGTNLAVWKLKPQLLADYLASRETRFNEDFSPLEIDGRRLPVTAIVDTTDWDGLRTLDSFPAFLERYAQHKEVLSQASPKHGTPHTIVVTASGLRAADIVRALRTFQTDESVVAKLFAKHIKLSEAVKYVRRTRMSIGIGTPARLVDLLNSGSLASEALRRIVVDSSYIDKKKRGILDMKETQKPLMDLLCREEFKTHYGAHKDPRQVLFF